MQSSLTWRTRGDLWNIKSKKMSVKDQRDLVVWFLPILRCPSKAPPLYPYLSDINAFSTGRHQSDNYEWRKWHSYYASFRFAMGGQGSLQLVGFWLHIVLAWGRGRGSVQAETRPRSFLKFCRDCDWGRRLSASSFWLLPYCGKLLVRSFWFEIALKVIVWLIWKLVHILQ